MGGQRVIHLEDDAASAELVRLTFQRAGIDAEVTVVDSQEGFQRACAEGPPRLVISDHDVPGFSGLAALSEVRARMPQVPFVFLCSSGGRERVVPCLEAGADDFLPKDQLWRLPHVARRLLGGHRFASEVGPPTDKNRRGLERLVMAVKELSLARSMDEIAAVVRSAARSINGADGATFVLRDGGQCHYFDEDAIAPLWKGRRFPLETCISGWAMMNKAEAVIEDIYVDPRIPHDAYRPTFVKSLVMVPVRKEAPIAAIGNYWGTRHQPSAEEVALIQALADSTSVAMENVAVYNELEHRVNLRTAELAVANRELEAFSYSVSHDLRTPLAQIAGFAELVRDDLDVRGEATRHVDYIMAAAQRMNELIEDLLRLGRTARAEMAEVPVDLGDLGREIIACLGPAADEARVTWRVGPGLMVKGDPALLRVLLENLLGNALKYSGKKPAAIIELDAGSAADGRREFFVRDNGAGFDQAQADHLFAPFQRLHAASEFPGTGVGLATCQRIVHRHGGRIRAEGVPDRGATVTFSLPVP